MPYFIHRRSQHYSSKKEINVFHGVHSLKSPTFKIGDKYVSINQLITYPDKINLASKSI